MKTYYHHHHYNHYHHLSIYLFIIKVCFNLNNHDPRLIAKNATPFRATSVAVYRF